MSMFRRKTPVRGFSADAYLRAESALRLRAGLSGGGPLTVGRSASGVAALVAPRGGFLATLSGSSSPYSFTEAIDTTGSGYVAGPRTGTANAYEVNGVAGLGGKVAWIEPGAPGDYRFQWNCLCPPGIVACGCSSIPTTLNLSTPWGTVPVTWSGTLNGWYGCGTASVLSAPYPSPTFSSADPLDYGYPGSTGTSSWSLATASCPFAVFVQCNPGLCTNKWALVIAFAQAARITHLPGGGFGDDLNYFLPTTPGVCTNGATTANTATIGANGTDNVCTQPYKTSLTYDGGTGGGGTMRETYQWPGTSIASSYTSGGGFLSYTGIGIGTAKCADAGFTCSPFFVRWTNMVVKLGAYGPWTGDNVGAPGGTCYRTIGVGGTGLGGQTLTGTFTLTP